MFDYINELALKVDSIYKSNEKSKSKTEHTLSANIPFP